jgi:RimJ/RimL family protein N-acetyltransferase
MRFTYCAPDRDATRVFLEAHAARFAEDGFAPWVAELREGGRVVGWGGLNRDPHAPHWGVEVSYFVQRDCWGRGLAGEIVAAALALAFGSLRLAEVGAFTRPANHASARVLTRAGFERTGYVPELERDRYRVRAQRRAR